MSKEYSFDFDNHSSKAGLISLINGYITDVYSTKMSPLVYIYANIYVKHIGAGIVGTGGAIYNQFWCQGVYTTDVGLHAIVQDFINGLPDYGHPYKGNVLIRMEDI